MGAAKKTSDGRRPYAPMALFAFVLALCLAGTIGMASDESDAATTITVGAGQSVTIDVSNYMTTSELNSFHNDGVDKSIGGLTDNIYNDGTASLSCTFVSGNKWTISAPASAKAGTYTLQFDSIDSSGRNFTVATTSIKITEGTGQGTQSSPLSSVSYVFSSVPTSVGYDYQGYHTSTLYVEQGASVSYKIMMAGYAPTVSVTAQGSSGSSTSYGGISVSVDSKYDATFSGTMGSSALTMHWTYGAITMAINLVPVSSGTPVTSISVSGSTSLVAGSSTTYSATAYPTSATDRTVTWSSSNTSVATVSSSGLVTAKSSGSAIIKATANDGSGVYNSKTVTVSALTASISGPTSAYTGEATSYSVSSNAGSTSLQVTSSPSNSSSDYYVSGQNVYFYTAGQYTLTATATNGGVTATKKLTVTATERSYDYSVQCYVDGSLAKTLGGPSTDTSCTVTLTYTPSKTNATFKGWATSSGGSVVHNGGADVKLYSSSPTLKLYAVFEYTATLSFVYTPGAGGPQTITNTTNTASNISVPIPTEEPTRGTDYKFLGWATSASGSPAYSSSSSSLGLTSTYSLGCNSNDTLYAVWAKTYTSTLKYDVGDAVFSGTDTVTDPSTSSAGVTIQITDAVPISINGYVFKGWALSDGGDPAYGHLDGLQTSIPVGAGKTTTLYAVWYLKVTYDGNGGTPSKTSDEIRIGNLALLPTANKDSDATSIAGGVTGTTYVLLGWSTDPNSATADSGFTAGARVSLTKSTALYAIWETKEGTTYYTVTFDPNGGKCDTEKLEGVVSSLPTASRDDSSQDIAGGRAVTSYKLLGWSKDQSATKADADAGSRFVPTENTVLYAIWSPDTVDSYYTVTFDPNGGTCATEKLEGVVSSLPSATRESTRTDLGGGYTDTAYTFLGWATSKDAKVADLTAGASLTPTSDMTLYAIWKEDSETTVYKLTYDPDNGEAVRVDEFVGETVKLARTIKSWGFAKEGYTLTGWSETKGSETAEYRTGDQIAVSKDTTIYAVWVDSSKAVYTAYLRYDASGGEDCPGDQTIVGTDQGNRVFTVTSIIPTKQYRSFAGWSETEGSATAEYQPGDKVTVAYDGEKTLYAVWTSAKALVVFDANGGSPVESVQVIQGEKFELPSASMDGMDLEGWYLGDQRVGGAGDSYIVGSDVTLKAHWKEHTDGGKGFPLWILILLLIIIGLIVAKIAGVY